MALVVKDKDNKGKKKTKPVWFWSPECKYEVILNHVKGIQWKLIDDEKSEDKCNVYWIDVATIHERFKSIQPWQMINHFPGMPNIARKNRMGQNLNRMQKLYPKEYGFYPRTWVLPGEINDFRQQFDSTGVALNNKIFIIKPDAGCQGRGIFLTRTWDQVPQGENVVAQSYIKKPLLLDGYKFDLRIYVLVTSVKPLRMYLFHDGLVRMCTEEYVKPNKQNISMSQMHLTNYAVNKTNNNFVQPNTGDSANAAGQDGASKRSLVWFLNHVKELHGEEKEQWMFKRIGTLCVRTILSIMPTLSREYDQHFKSFSGIPRRMTEIVKQVQTGSSVVQTFKVDSEEFQQYLNNSDDEGLGDQAEEKEKEKSNKSEEEQECNGGGGGEKKPKRSSDGKPFFRGSRAFEILGFDIMIDSELRPILIEVNHLPSFGTDSPLDLDIKDRLMKQSFESLSVMADDEFAYNLFQKVETEKRLSGQRAKELKEQRERDAKEKEAKEKLIRMKKMEQKYKRPPAKLPPPPPEKPKKIVMAEPFDDGDCKPERFAEIKVILADLYKLFSPEKVSKIDRLLEKYKNREEEFLKFVYQKYNVTPPWVLLEEEEEKCQVVESEPLPVEGGSGDAGGGNDDENNNSNNSNSNSENNNTEGSNNDEDSIYREGRSSNNDAISKDSGSSSSKNLRASRSMSPPSAKNRKQEVYAKNLSMDEESDFREDILNQHVPKDDDEWMRHEMSVLHQFTRIFPALGSRKKESGGSDGLVGAKDEKECENGINGSNSNSNDDNNNNGEEEDGDEDNANDNDDDDKGQPQSKSEKEKREKEKKDKAKFKAASYEDILFQVFLQDRRQTMRLRCPLPARVRPTSEQADNQSIASLDQSRSNASGMGMGMGGGGKSVGWGRPKDGEKKDNAVIKVPTEAQLSAANRLSQGLSVAENYNKISSRRKMGMNNKTNAIFDVQGEIDAETLELYARIIHQGQTQGIDQNQLLRLHNLNLQPEVIRELAMQSQAQSINNINGNKTDDKALSEFLVMQQRLLQQQQLQLQQHLNVQQNNKVKSDYRNGFIPTASLKQQVFAFDSNNPLLPQQSMMDGQQQGAMFIPNNNNHNYNNNNHNNLSQFQQSSFVQGSSSTNSNRSGGVTGRGGQSVYQIQQQQQTIGGINASYSHLQQQQQQQQGYPQGPYPTSSGLTASVTGSGGILNPSNSMFNLSGQSTVLHTNRKQQQQQQHSHAPGVAGVSANVNSHSRSQTHLYTKIGDENNQEAVLKQLFPGWF